jgi:soluble lytic murein transglycosylase-like protein
MRFVIAALLVFVVMMINLNSVSEHAAGRNLRDKNRNENQVAYPDRAADPDSRFSIYFAQGAMNVANAAVPPAEEPPAAEEQPAVVADEAIEPRKADFCDALRQAAESVDIPVAFFARLLWQESRFRSDEISRAGAQGVAQFMPTTAAEVGLDDPFDPYKALPASARLLQKLRREFGNLGLAAAAYNAGSGRIQKWLSRQSSLPKETRDYVRIITGSAATEWIVESKTVSLRLELPRGAPCEGVGGLSKSTEVANVPVALAPSVSDAMRKAEAEAQRVAVARAEAAAKQKEHAALQKERKELAEKASPRHARTASAKTVAAAAASHHQIRTAKNSGRVKVASAGR